MNQQHLTNFSNIPIGLQRTDQWVNWGENPQKPKQPSTPKNGFHKWQQNQCSFELVKACAEKKGLGVGITFCGQTEFFGIDLDGCVDPSSGQIEPWAYAIVLFASSYCEVSPSGTGLKIICRRHVDVNLEKIVFGIAKHGSHQQHVEFMTVSGYFALTGNLHPSLQAYPLRLCGALQLHERIKIYQRVLAYLAATPPAIEGKGGDMATFTTACTVIHGFDLTPSEAVVLVTDWNGRCSPPWSEKELQHKFNEADKREDGQGRQRGYMLEQESVPILQSVIDFCNEHFPNNAVNEKASAQPSNDYVAFPTDLLPHPLCQFVTEVSNAIGCDPSFVALPLLAALAGAIGDSRRLFVKSGWLVPAIIWAAVIGESGTAKSPAFRAVMKYPKQHQAAIRDKFAEQQKQYEHDLDIHEVELKRWKQKKLWQGGTPRPEVPEKPPYLRTTVSDATLEGLVSILEENPNGVLAEFDELAGFFGSFDKYRSGSGSDSATWLSIYNGDSITVDRKGTGHTFVPAAYVSITGNIQPGVLPDCFTSKHRESGMMARFLMALPNRIAKQWNENEISNETNGHVARLFSYLYSLEPQIDDASNRTPYLFYMNPEAKQHWISFYNRHNQELAEHSGSMAAAYSKLEEYPLRFALIFHCVKQAMGFAPDHYIQADTIQSAIALTDWFKNESQRIQSLMSFGEKKTDTERLVEFIRNKGGVVTSRVLQRSNKKRYPTSPVAEAALNELVEAGLGQWEKTTPPITGGRASKQFRLLA